jgi:hypothetical protein
LKRQVVPYQTGSPESGAAQEIEGYFKMILESGKLQSELRSGLESAVGLAIDERAPMEQARSQAVQQARKTYRCEGCGLEFLGTLAFAAHDEETSHMKNRSKQVSIGSHLEHDSVYRTFTGD